MVIYYWLNLKPLLKLSRYLSIALVFNVIYMATKPNTVSITELTSFFFGIYRIYSVNFGVLAVNF